MQPLEPPDSHHLNAAVGWLGLNAPADAREELAQISAANRLHPDVLEAQWMLCAHEKRWADALAVALQEIEWHGDEAGGWLHRAYALRRVEKGGLPQAWEALLPAAEKFPKEPVIPYNLACYACQLGRLDEARAWLQRAIKAGEKNSILKMALADDDLMPLRREIREM